ncbi:UDP-glycosyltransferase UGT5-like [Planococcus citri]|uniref:UDP-glycosyltransferase UGT5-like n=1 Tax=Planococcus citri TaxID=170843 RepID=UPI0031F83045
MISLKIAFVLLYIASAFLIQIAHSAKILYLYSIGCKSAASMHQAISKILLHNHHELIALSPFQLTENFANYTDLDVHDDFFEFSDQFLADEAYIGTYENRKFTYQIQRSNCENIYRNAKVVEMLNNTRVDLILWETENGECFLPLLAKFQVPIIGVNSGNFLFPDLDGLMGNPVNPSYVPSALSGFSSRMDFFQRLQNTKDYLLNLLINWYYIREADIFANKYFKSPPIQEIYYDRVSLVFSNSHFCFLPKPTAPGTVDIAGIHIGKPSLLPKEIQTFIESSTEGVIYLSLGSVTKFSGLPKHIQDSFVQILQKLPYRVIWRHDKPETIPKASKNILVKKWLPQKDILAHPKVILFISHCGIFSTYEAIYFGVPILAFPVIYDQFTNAAILENLQVAVTLDWRTFEQEYLQSSIEDVIENKKYRDNIEKLSNIFRDRPQSPQNTLLYWVDYVLRHKHVSHLKPAGAKLPFHQYLLLDVILFLSVVFIVISCIIYFILKKLVSILGNMLRKKSVMKKTKTY